MNEALPVRLIDIEGERLILSNLLAEPEFCKSVLPQLDPADFAGDLHQRVFQAIRSAIQAGYEPGLAGIYRWLLDGRKTRDDFGLPVLSELAWDNSIPLANPGPWISSLHRARAERRAWRIAEKLRLGIEAGETEALESAREELRQVDLDPVQDTAGTIGETLARIDVNQLLQPPRGMIASPWPNLTRDVNGGPRPGELWVVGARPSVGKTLVLLQWSIEAAANGHRTKLFSLEMPVADLMRRAICSEGRVPHAPLQRGDLSEDWRRVVAETLDRISAYPLEINDRCRSLASITASIASASKSGAKLALVAIDYLGLIESDGRHENRNQEVAFLSRRLKTLAMDYNIPILAAHQLNRSSESESRKPSLSDLRDSGALEQDADVVLLLDSPARRSKKVSPDAPPDAVDVIVAKQRNGPRGMTVQLRLEAKFCRLEET